MSNLYFDWLTSFHAKDIADLGIKINVVFVIFWRSSFFILAVQNENQLYHEMLLCQQLAKLNQNTEIKLYSASSANSYFNISEMISGGTVWAALCSYPVKGSCCLFAAPADKGLHNTLSWWYTQSILQPDMGQTKDVFYTSGWKLTSCFRLCPRKGLVWLGSEHGRDFCILLEFCNVLIKES